MRLRPGGHLLALGQPEQATGVGRRHGGELLGRHPAQLGHRLGRLDQVRRFVTPAAARLGSKVRAIGLKHKGVRGQGPCHGLQAVVVRVGDRARDGDEEAQGHVLQRALRPVGVAMQHAQRCARPRTPPGPRPRGEYLPGGVLRVAGMDHHRQVQPGGELQLTLEGRPLHLRRREVAVEIEPHFAQRHHQRVGRQALQLFPGCGGGVLRVVRVDAGGSPQPRFGAGQRQGGAVAGRIGADGDDSGDAGCPRPRQHGGTVGVEGLGLGMRVRVDELHQTPSRASSCSATAGSSFLNNGSGGRTGRPGCGGVKRQPPASTLPSSPRNSCSFWQVNGRYG